MPHCLRVCSGLVAIHKASGWEVDAQTIGFANVLCIWLQYVCPKISHPVMHDEERSFGLAHRIDRICSGLLIAAGAFEVHTLV